MGILGRDDKLEREETPGDLAGLHLDFDLRVCPGCGREFPAWRATCPEDGATLVRPDQAPSRAGDIPIPEHLRVDDAAPTPAPRADDTGGGGGDERAI